MGQDEFNDIILRPKNRAIRQRITINYTVEPLKEDETEKYIRYRLKVAGSDQDIFSSGAIRAVHQFSGGYPRLINIICDHALLSGYVQDKKSITAEIIHECAQELKISPQSKRVNGEAKTENDAQVTPEPVIEHSSKEKSRMPIYLVFALILIIWLSVVGFFIITGNKARIGTKPPVVKKVIPEKKDAESIPKTDKESAATIDEDIVKTDGEKPVESGIAEKSEDAMPAMVKEDATDTSATAEERKVVSATIDVREETGVDKNNTDATITKPESEIALSQSGNNEKKVTRNDDSEIKKEEMVTLTLKDIETIYGEIPWVSFGFDKNQLDDSGYHLLNDIALMMIDNPELKATLKGFTDASGVRAYNIKLSRFRANIVKTYLVGKGVDPERLITKGMKPDDFKKIDDSEKPSRRVDIIIGNK